MMPQKAAFRVSSHFFSSLLLVLTFSVSFSTFAQGDLDRQLDTGWGFSVRYPATWSLLDSQFINSYTLVNVPADQQGQQRITARIKVYREVRRSYDEAVAQISAAAVSVKAPASGFVSVSGWPALNSLRLDERPQPNKGTQFADDQVLRVHTWVAAGDMLIQVYATLPKNASGELVAQAQAVAASIVTEEAAKASQTDDTLEKLRADATKAAEASSAGAQISPPTARDIAWENAAFPKRQSPPSRANLRVYPDRWGEVEIAVSNNGNTLVVGRQSEWVTSTDSGATFSAPRRINAFDGGDPSLGTGASGAFYYAGIDRNCHNSGYQNPPAALGFGQDCTGMARSTDNGANFTIATVNPAVACPRDDPNNPGAVANRCFPDQEHIAADRFNAGGGGGDQVYSTWRNFDAAGQDGALVCTQDSGLNWTAPFDLGGGSFFPRITVGGDGFVYVVAYGGGNYRLWKFSSCSNGLALQPGFPVNVFGRDPVDCPFAGHDRCDQNPSSHTVAVDDTNPNHIYFAVADADGTGNRDGSIMVLDSLDGGLTWRAPVRAHPNIPGPRIMPWVCATGGDAYVTWFDRRAASPCPGGNCPGIQNDLTHFYAAQVGLDGTGALVAKGEFQVSEVAHAWCGPPNTGWPAATRQATTPAPGASEACSLQPQLGGQCCIDADVDGACDQGTATGARCDISDNTPAAVSCNAGEVCLGGGGIPRYGDYNGNACIAGRLYAAWPSATSPPNVAPAVPGQEGILFDSFLVGAVPLLTIPSSVNFGRVCGLGPHTSTLQICNTGNANLVVSSIDSDDSDFEVTTPSSGFPLQISPDFCFPFEVSFSSGFVGNDDAVLTVNSNDPIGPVDIPVSADVGTGDLQVAIANSGDFGNVCSGEVQDLNLTLFNQGSCDLAIDDITVSDPRFVLPDQVEYPLVLSPDADFNFPVRFAPDSCGAMPVTALLAINNNETEVFSSGFERMLDNKLAALDEAPKNVILDVPLSGSAPCPELIMDPGEFETFPTTVVDADGTLGCFAEQRVVLRNAGSCPLTITDISAGGADFTVRDPTEFPLRLPPGEETLTTTVRFAPLSDPDPLTPNEVTSALTITSEDLPPFVKDLCGESAAQSGVRVLVTDITSGSPVVIDEVDKIIIRDAPGHKAGSPRINLLYKDVPASMASICGQLIDYHVNEETLPAPATYDVYAKDDRVDAEETVELGQCDFKEVELQLDKSHW
ncbi:MAG: choice-of-anchor D domain-containing protein [Pseudomonadota bacterium]